MSSYLAIVDGDGIPLWMLEPTMDNILTNVIVEWMRPLIPCVVIMEHDNGTCLVVYDGVLAYAVTECLFEAF